MRKVEIGGQTIEDVAAIVVPTQNAPLLLGQTVIQRLGKVSIDGDYLVIHNANIYTEDEIAAIYEKAEDLLENKVYSEALKYYRIVYDFWGEEVDPWVLYSMGVCYHNLKDRNSAEKCHLKAIELDNGKNEDGILYEVNSKLAAISSLDGDHNKSLEYSMLMQKYAASTSERANAFNSIGSEYSYLNKYSDAISYSDKAINTYRQLLRKRKLDSYEAMTYILSFIIKGSSLEDSRRYDEAIETYSNGKKALESFKNENFYNDDMDVFNNGLSRCYTKLANH